jgi:WD40 repeat protein
VGVDGAGYRELRGHGDAVNTVAFAADGAALLSASDDGDSRIWDLASGLSRPLARGTAVAAARWLDGGAAIIDLADDGVVRIAADGLPRGEALRAWLRAQADAVDP